jgi:thymidylate synthase
MELYGGAVQWRDGLEQCMPVETEEDVWEIGNTSHREKASLPRVVAYTGAAAELTFKLGVFDVLVQPSREGAGRSVSTRGNPCEANYLQVLRNIIANGYRVIDRTQVGCRQLIGQSLEYDISGYRLPVFTHRRMFFRGILEELLFFISGKTDTKILESKGVNIWKKHTSAEWLQQQGLPYDEGCYGPAYGFQLRHWGGDHDQHLAGNDPGGVDQLQMVVDLLKHNPQSRRVLFSYWNPSVLGEVALPSCHLVYQFHVEGDVLSCSFYQRSNDFALAANFNVVSASLLTMMLCKVVGLSPGKVVHMIGNTHVYENQVDEVRAFMNNRPRFAPLVNIKSRDSMDDFKSEDFELSFYFPHRKYPVTMTA